MNILFEDNHLIIINKEVSDLVQSDETGDEVLGDKVKAYIKRRYKKPGDVFLGVVHRLDRPVTGAVIFARTSKALARMNEQFKEHEVKKTYWAVVKNRPENEEGELLHYLVKDEMQNKSYAYPKPKGKAKEARLSYRLIGTTNNFFLLEVDLHTGRHHQIRCQLAKIGCPIKGDLKYGFARSNPDGGIHLHARRIRFNHPVTKEPLDIIAEPPQDQLWMEFLEQAETQGGTVKKEIPIRKLRKERQEREDGGEMPARPTNGRSPAIRTVSRAPVLPPDGRNTVQRPDGRSPVRRTDSRAGGRAPGRGTDSRAQGHNVDRRSSVPRAKSASGEDQSKGAPARPARSNMSTRPVKYGDDSRNPRSGEGSRPARSGASARPGKRGPATRAFKSGNTVHQVKKSGPARQSRNFKGSK